MEIVGLIKLPFRKMLKVILLMQGSEVYFIWLRLV